MNLNYLTNLRKELHSMPELSGREEKTSKKLYEELQKLKPDKIIRNLGGYGLAAVFEGKSEGKTVMFRADIDALPIPEANDFDYISKNPGIAHKCGHDGHSTILIGFGGEISKLNKEFSGRIVLLFQPAEETAQGAKAVLEDPEFKEIEPDYIFGLHNLPGFKKGSVILKEDIFASASRGMIIRLKGETSHAGHPENGRSPAPAAASIIHGLHAAPSMSTSFSNSALITVIHVKIGEVAFGTTPGEAVLMATLRTHENADMKAMSDYCEKMACGIAETYGLDCSIEYVEIFPATVNSRECFKTIEKAASKAGLEKIYKTQPFPWSEDFGWYLQKYKGAFFGIGSGENSPQLHNSDYDFPDEIIEPAVKMFFHILEVLRAEH